MPGKVASENGESGLTATESRFVKALFENMSSKPDADWDQVAKAVELKDAKCAKERFRQICKRHDWYGGTASPKKADTTGASADGKVTKKRGPAKKRGPKVKTEEVAESPVGESREGSLTGDEDEDMELAVVKEEEEEHTVPHVKEEVEEKPEVSGQI